MNKKHRKKVVELLTKMNSEGMEYYFTSYTSPGFIERDCPFLVDSIFIEKVRAYESAHSDLQGEIDRLIEEYEINQEEIEY